VFEPLTAHQNFLVEKLSAYAKMHRRFFSSEGPVLGQKLAFAGIGECQPSDTSIHRDQFSAFKLAQGFLMDKPFAIRVIRLMQKPEHCK
jgi:hypothetical protein